MNYPRTFIVVGAGPVGLYAALLLLDSGLSGKILEQRPEPHSHSRAIGIHPPSLHLFNKWGIDRSFIKEGIEVQRGFAHVDDESHLLDLSNADARYNGVIVLPQFKTESIIRRVISDYDSDCIQWGTSVNHLEEKTVYISNGQTYNADLIIDAQGKSSWFADKMHGNIEPYDDFYIMGDFDHPVNLGFNAHIYLHRQGLVESFPLNAHKRRWVVKTPSFIKNPTAEQIADIVASRTGLSLSTQSCTMTSSFIPESGWRSPNYNGVIRIGDAQHIVSPIGGQGMNLGWVNAHDLLTNMLDKNTRLLKSVIKRNSTRYRSVKRRSEFNMMMGRASDSYLHSLRKFAARIITTTPFDRFFIRQFTMGRL